MTDGTMSRVTFYNSRRDRNAVPSSSLCDQGRFRHSSNSISVHDFASSKNASRNCAAICGSVKPTLTSSLSRNERSSKLVEPTHYHD